MAKIVSKSSDAQNNISQVVEPPKETPFEEFSARQFPTSSDGAALHLLPHGILSSEHTIGAALHELDASGLPLAEKIQAIDRQDLWPFLHGSVIKPDFRLLIDIAPDLSSITFSEIISDLSSEDLNGNLPIDSAKLKILAEIPDPKLMFSAGLVHAQATPLNHEILSQLIAYGKRITRFMGVAVTWDQAVDKHVWTTNIDTVNFIRALSNDGFFSRKDVQRTMEVGIGGGAISKTVLTKMPHIETHIGTDISPYALMCSKRNISPSLAQGQSLGLYLGKGIRNIATSVDALLINPPYIPTPQPPDETDPYRGTGLIKEAIECGRLFLNKSNPRSALYVGMSSLAQRDLDNYLSTFQTFDLEIIGEPVEVPLKIYKVEQNEKWIDYLIEQHGLLHYPKGKDGLEFPYWHSISVIKLTPKWG